MRGIEIGKHYIHSFGSCKIDANASVLWDNAGNPDTGAGKKHAKKLSVSTMRFGTVEVPPTDLQDPLETMGTDRFQGAGITDISSDSADDSSRGADQNQEIPAVQSVGSLILTRTVTLDAHFVATYASSSDFLELINTPSGSLTASWRKPSMKPLPTGSASTAIASRQRMKAQGQKNASSTTLMS